jgi:Rieske Fe-S protein
MSMNRKQFLMLTAALATGCQTAENGGAAGGTASAAGGTGGHPRVVDAGPAEQYAADGVYENHRSQGFFLVRRGGSLTALSSVCTHRTCKLNAEADRTFYCPCHGSTFDPGGHVTEGPAVRDLPVYATVHAANGHVMVTLPG